MSTKKPSNPASNPNQPGNRRELLQQQRDQAAKERKVRNLITYGILGVAVLAIVGVIVAVVVSARNAPVDPGGGATTDQYTLVVGESDAPVTVSIFQDYMCPFCGDFERANRADLETMVTDGTAKIEFHVMNFLDGGSQGSKYSTRAANAVVAVAKAEPEHLMAFNAALFENQPEESTGGLSDAQIADLARQAGVSNEVVATFASMSNADFVNRSNTAANEAGVRSTPTIKIDGAVWPADGNTAQMYQAGPLKAAVAEAAAQK